MVEFYLEIDDTAVVHLEWLMSVLAYQPWASRNAATAYERATFRGFDAVEADPISADATYTFEDFARNFPEFVLVRFRPVEEQDDGEAW